MFSVVGNISKMQVALDSNNTALYKFVLDNQPLDEYIVNNLLEKKIIIEFQNIISCIHCNRVIKKSFNQGYCFPCFRKLASCDSCILKPEQCHYHNGTCREPEWGLAHCMQKHYVYLANSSGLKVGLTRGTQIPIRWIDQGAGQALIIAQTLSRYQAGLLEVICKKYMNDKTNWREMLKNNTSPLDLEQIRDKLFLDLNNNDKEYKDLIINKENYLQENNILSNSQGKEIELLVNEKAIEICYPVKAYPSKITSFNLDKKPTAEGTLMGIKGQYLILDTGVINIRKYTGYKLSITVS